MLLCLDDFAEEVAGTVLVAVAVVDAVDAGVVADADAVDAGAFVAD